MSNKAASITAASYDPTVDGVFKPSEEARDRSIVLALTGPSGSGKTFTALTLATYLAGEEGRIAVVDTEATSSLIYRNRFKFNFVDFKAPFLPSNFGAYIEGARKAKYNVLIIDSLTPAWTGSGGVLEIANGDFRGWKIATPEQDKLFRAITDCRSSKMHIICTIRSKQDYVMQPNIRGGTEVVKLGVEPIQRPGVDYEFDVVLDLDVTNTAKVVKTRYGDQLPMGERFIKPGAEVADLIRQALDHSSSGLA